jgi:hypothetical protein
MNASNEITMQRNGNEPIQKSLDAFRVERGNRLLYNTYMMKNA